MRKLIEDDAETLDLYDQAVQGRHGGDQVVLAMEEAARVTQQSLEMIAELEKVASDLDLQTRKLQQHI